MSNWQALNASADSPIAKLGNVSEASTKDIKTALASVRKRMRTLPPPKPMSWSDGWAEFTPDDALLFLQHQEITKGNRRLSQATILKYARAMLANDWRQTGEVIKKDENGIPLDGQHRAWAVVFTGVTVRTFLVSSIKPQENLFAYMDNSKHRSNADALETAGLNGNSALIDQTVALLRRYENNALNNRGKDVKIVALQPAEIVAYTNKRPTLRTAIRVLTRDHKKVHKDLVPGAVGGVTAVKLLELYGEDTLHSFFTGLQNADDSAPNRASNPLVALKARLKVFDGEVPAQPKAIWLSAVITGFNAWRLKRKMKQVVVDAATPYPRFDVPPPAEEEDDESEAA